MKYIDSDAAFKDFVRSLEDRNIRKIALDLEGEFNLHCYGEHLCLLQVYDEDEAVLIDPFAVELSLLKDFLENQNLAKIMYDCSGDRTLLFRQCGIDLKNIEDLFPAAELIDLEKRNLSFVLYHFLGIEPMGKKKFQQYNWMRRPIRRDALDYAAEDVLHLFRLQKALMDELAALDLLAEYEKKNQEAQNRPVNTNPVPGVFKKNRFKKMPVPLKKLFKELFYIREEAAERLNVPPNTLLSNENLYKIVVDQLPLERIRFPHFIPRDQREKLLRDFEKTAKKQ